MNKLQERKLLHLVTRHLLLRRGNELPDGYSYEWDPMASDSQYSMCYEDVEFMLEALSKYGYEIVERKPYDYSRVTAGTAATTV